MIDDLASFAADVLAGDLPDEEGIMKGFVMIPKFRQAQITMHVSTSAAAVIRITLSFLFMTVFFRRPGNRAPDSPDDHEDRRIKYSER